MYLFDSYVKFFLDKSIIPSSIQTSCLIEYVGNLFNIKKTRKLFRIDGLKYISDNNKMIDTGSHIIEYIDLYNNKSPLIMLYEKLNLLCEPVNNDVKINIKIINECTEFHLRSNFDKYIDTYYITEFYKYLKINNTGYIDLSFIPDNIKKFVNTEKKIQLFTT